MYTDKITICIPVYERYDYFEEAIGSALSQSVTCKIVVSDNGSSTARFRKYCFDNNIDYYRNESNLGIFANWNKCFQRAESEYVMIFGDDDIMHIDFVKEFLEAEETYNGLDFYYTNVDILTGSEKKDWSLPALYGFFNKSLDLLELAARQTVGIPSISGVFRRAMMLETPFAEKYYGSNDWLWLYTNMGNIKVYGNKNKLLDYRQHDKQDSTQGIFITWHWSYPVIYYVIYENLKNKSIFANNALSMSIRFALDTLMRFEFKFFDYYHSLDDSNAYKLYYKEKISKKSVPLYLLTLPKYIGYWSLRVYFKIHYFLKKVHS